MNNELVKSVQDTVKEYIDNVDDKKVTDRTLEKLDKLHKEFLANIFVQVKPMFGEHGEIKNKVEEIKQKKVFKGATKAQKVEFSHVVINELIDLIRSYEISSDTIEAHKQFTKNIRSIKSWNKYEQWFSWALDFGKDSYLATHIAKLSHSSSKGSSVDVRYHDSCDKYDARYITTNGDVVLDTAYPDNKYSSISQFYNICVAGYYIGDLLREGDGKYLHAFTKNDELLKLWTASFAGLIKNDKKQSYFLSKQVYFPTQDRQYHLLMPLTSSSLVHALHLEHKKYFDEDQKNAIKQKNLKKYSAKVIRTYPKKAYVHVTGSNHSNASSLNGKRGGRIALLSAIPPQWQSRLSSYVNKYSVFDKKLAFELQDEISDLARFLFFIKNKSLSISAPNRNATVLNKLRAISSQLFNYLETINANEIDEGWTASSKLPPAQQLMFEPRREDMAAKSLKINEKWQKTLSQTYGRWLNQQLAHKGRLKLTTVHAALWEDCFLHELKEMIATQKVTL